MPWLVAAPAVAEEASGTFGFSAKVDVDGVFRPRLKSVLIGAVTPGMPAAVAGVAPGDSVLEVEGQPILGKAAADIAPLMKKAPGETLLMKLKRTSGDVYTVRLTATRR